MLSSADNLAASRNPRKWIADKGVEVGQQVKPHDEAQSPSQRMEDLRARLEAAAQRAGRDAAEVITLAISKTKPVEAITPFLDLGHRCFGENRVQEANEKWPPLRAQYDAIELHLVGPLQSNKVEQAVALFDVIQTLDRPKVAAALAKAGDKHGSLPALYIQVNTGEEPQKAGIAPAELAAFAAQCRDDYGLQIDGLMCIPPADQAAGPHFALLNKLAGEIGVEKLSMGMSGDFETAIAQGATHIRLGTTLFGPRN